MSIATIHPQDIDTLIAKLTVFKAKRTRLEEMRDLVEYIKTVVYDDINDKGESNKKHNVEYFTRHVLNLEKMVPHNVFSVEELIAVLPVRLAALEIEASNLWKDLYSCGLNMNLKEGIQQYPLSKMIVDWEKDNQHFPERKQSILPLVGQNEATEPATLNKAPDVRMAT